MTALRSCRRTGLLLALLLAAAAAPAQAEPATQPADRIEVDLTLAAVSDYRYRGLSLSDRKPSVQADLALSHPSGVNAALWAATIADNGGADIENQITIGYSSEQHGLTLDVQVYYYFYPGAAGDNYAEAAVRIGRAFGAVEAGATVSYAPAQANIGRQDNIYVGFDGSVPLTGTPLTLSGAIGLEDGAFGDRKIDWSLGANAEIATLTLGLHYIDSRRSFDPDSGGATLVASISKSF